MGGVVKAIKKVVKAVTKTVKTVVKAAVSIVKSVVNLVGDVVGGLFSGLGLGGFDTPEFSGGEQFDNSLSGILVNKQSNVAKIPVVYGRRKLGGTRVFVATSGSDNKYLYICLVLCEGEIDSFEGVYINDERQNIDSFATGGIRTIQSSKFGGGDSSFHVNGTARAKFEFFTGTEDQSASSLLKEQSQWTDSHRLRGVAYVAARFEWVKAEFDSEGKQTVFNPFSGIPKINVIVKGKKVLTSYSSKNTSSDSSTYESETGSFVFSDNPADCILDYLRNPRYGKGLNDNRLDFAEFHTARGICDTSSNFGGSLGTADLLTINQHIQLEDTLFQNTKKMMQTCRGFLPYVNGKYALRIEAAESSPGNLFNINDDNIIGAITITSEEKNTKYNTAKVTFANSEKEFESDTVIFQNATFLAEDNEELSVELGMPGITHRERALEFAEYLVRRSRKMQQVTVTTTSEGQNVVAGDLVTITHRYKAISDASGDDYNDFLYNEKIFRVGETRLNFDGTVQLGLIEHQNDIYSVTVQQEDTDLSGIQAIKQNSIFAPLYVPVANDGAVTADTRAHSSAIFVQYKVREDDQTNSHIHIDQSLNGGTFVASRRGARDTSNGDIRPDKFYTLNGQPIQIGDKLRFNVYTVSGSNQMVLLQSGSVIIVGSTANTVVTLNVTEAGF